MIKQLQPNHLGISNGLLEFLAPEEDKRLSKLEAYFDLLVMATHYKKHVSCFGQEFNLVPGEIVTSISVRVWHVLHVALLGCDDVHAPSHGSSGCE